MPDLSHSLANFRAALDDIRRMYSADEDAQALRDTALGETTLEADILSTLREVQVEEAESEACKAAARQLHERLMARANRKDGKIERLRAACLHAMQEASIDRLRAPDMSVSVGLSPAKVIITDEAKVLHLQAYRRETAEVNKAAVAEALKRGETVEGATLGNRSPYLRISVK